MKHYFNFLLFIFCFTSSFSQNQQQNCILYNRRYDDFLLKGSVKSVSNNCKYFDHNLNKKDSSFVLIALNNIKSYVYPMQFNYEFYKNGRDVKKSFYSIELPKCFLLKSDTIKQKFIIENEFKIFYDENDYTLKSKIKTNRKRYFPVLDYSLMLQSNYYDMTKKKDGGYTIWQHGNKVSLDKTGKVTSSISYLLEDDTNDTIYHPQEFENSDIDNIRTFVYNQKNQVVRINIKKAKIEYYGADVFAEFVRPVTICDDLHLDYSYDSKGRIIKIQLFNCKDKDPWASETYIYHPTKDYVQTVKTFWATNSESFDDVTRNNIRTYNEQGDLIKFECIPVNGMNKLDDIYKNQPLVRCFSYEYDSHNNWIICNVGLKEGDKSLVIGRDIEYFADNE
jgi:hypothetical protein